MKCNKQLVVNYDDERFTFAVACYGNCQVCSESALYQAAESAFEVFDLCGRVPENLILPNGEKYIFDMYLFDRYLAKCHFTYENLIANLKAA